MSDYEKHGISRFVSCYVSHICGRIRAKGGIQMDAKKIGVFLRELRKEKGLK